MIFAGIMSGSSLDGLDVAFVRFETLERFEISFSHTYALPESIINRIIDYKTLSVEDFFVLDADFSRFVGEKILDAAKKSGIIPTYIASHGHTLYHHPEQLISCQIGNGGIIAGITKIACISDFRTVDIALGGQGAPLAPLVDKFLFSGHDAYINLGGIANISRQIDSKLLGYDICPCNQVLNHFSEFLGSPYDDEGKYAAHGVFNDEVYRYFDSFEYFTAPPPKSLDNNWIMEVFIPGIPEANIHDILHTYVIWMVDQLVQHIDDSADSVFVSGGGVFNTFFMNKLRDKLSKNGTTLHVPKKEIIAYKESILMAFLGYRYINNQNNVMSSVTGSSSDNIGGALYKGIQMNKA